MTVLEPLLEIMNRLRDPETGCAWDVAQNFASIAPYTIEEAYEVADAIARDDMSALQDELGDLLLQVVFHSKIASDLGLFSIGDVVASIAHKMVRRHPHVFGDGVAGAKPDWEAIKAEERIGKVDDGALAGVALALPALMRAEKVQRRAARVGFDWPDAGGALAKIVEELGEVRSAATPAAQREEFGDLLFAVVNYARHCNVDPEVALHEGTRKFERRFGAMEAKVGPQSFADLDLAAKEDLWQAVKAAPVA